MLSEAGIEERMNGFYRASEKMATNTSSPEFTLSDFYRGVADELAFILQKEE